MHQNDRPDWDSIQHGQVPRYGLISCVGPSYALHGGSWRKRMRTTSSIWSLTTSRRLCNASMAGFCFGFSSRSTAQMDKYL